MHRQHDNIYNFTVSHTINLQLTSIAKEGGALGLNSEKMTVSQKEEEFKLLLHVTKTKKQKKYKFASMKRSPFSIFKHM